MKTDLTCCSYAERALQLFYQYLHISGQHVVTPHGEARLHAIEEELDALDFTIIIDEENADETVDEERGLEFLRMPAQLIVKGKPSYVLRQEVIVYTKISETPPRKLTISRFDVPFLRDARISIT